MIFETYTDNIPVTIIFAIIHHHGYRYIWY